MAGGCAAGGLAAAVAAAGAGFATAGLLVAAAATAGGALVGLGGAGALVDGAWAGAGAGEETVAAGFRSSRSTWETGTTIFPKIRLVMVTLSTSRASNSPVRR